MINNIKLEIMPWHQLPSCFLSWEFQSDTSFHWNEGARYGNLCTRITLNISTLHCNTHSISSYILISYTYTFELVRKQESLWKCLDADSWRPFSPPEFHFRGLVYFGSKYNGTFPYSCVHLRNINSTISDSLSSSTCILIPLTLLLPPPFCEVSLWRL